MSFVDAWTKASRNEWEDLYQRLEVEPTKADIVALLQASPVAATWLMLRVQLGPPGLRPEGGDNALTLLADSAEATVELAATVRRVQERLPAVSMWTVDSLGEAVLAEALPRFFNPTEVVLLAGWGRKLIGSLLCLRQLDEDDPLRGLPARVAADAIMELDADHLLPLRLDLLWDAARFAPTQLDAADTLMCLANTLAAVRGDDDDALREAVRIHDRARGLARETGNLELQANTTCMWARLCAMVTMDDPDGESTRSQLLDALDTLQLDGQPAWLRAKVLQVRATVVGHPGPNGSLGDHLTAAGLLEQALDILPPEDRWGYDTMRELATHLLQAGKTEQAIPWLKRCCNEGAAHLPPQDQAFLMSELERAYRRLGRVSEAERVGTEASRSAPDTNTRIQLEVQRANELYVAGAPSEALRIVRRLTGQADQVAPNHRFDIWRLSMLLEHSVGNDEAAWRALHRCRALVEGTGRGTYIRLLSTRLFEGPEQWMEAALAYVSGELGPRSSDADPIAVAILGDYANHLSDPQIRKVARWALDLASPSNAAQLLLELGQFDLASAVVGHALPDAEGREVAALLTVQLQLRRDAPLSERRALVSQLVDLLPHLPTTRFEDGFNAASACAMVADGDVDWLPRALDLWPTVLSWAAHDDDRTIGTTRWRDHLAEWMLAGRNASTPELARRMKQMADHVGHLDPARPGNSIALLGNAMLFGALTHPTVLDAVDLLLERLPASHARPDLHRRAQSIRAAQAAPGVVVLGLDSREADLPFAVPDWLVDAAVGHPVGPAPAGVLTDLQPWFLLHHARPDCLDRALGQSLPTVAKLSQAQQTVFLDWVSTVVQLGDHAPDAWSALGRALLALPADVPRRAALLTLLERGGTLPAGTVKGESEDALARFQQAVLWMDQVRCSPGAPESSAKKAQAVEMLTQLLGESHSGLHPADVRISLGNALRLQPNPEPGKAILLYEQLEPSALDPATAGKLHKVWADALMERNRAGDHTAAGHHLERALALRSGRVKGETHVSAARHAETDPNLDDSTRARVVGQHFIAAVALAPTATRPLLDVVLYSVRDWQRRAPQSFRPPQVRQVLVNAWPDREDTIDEALSGLQRTPFPADQTGFAHHISELLDHPAGRLYFDLVRGLLNPQEQQGYEEVSQAAGDPAVPLVPNIYDDPEAIEVRLTDLPTATDDTRVACLVAEAALRARLARLGRGPVEPVRALTLAARPLLMSPELPEAVATQLFDALVRLWAPDNDRSDPVRDFGLSVELARASIQRTTRPPSREQRIGLARALRYSTAGDRAENWAEARRLYEEVLADDRKGGVANEIANTLHLLADLITHTDGGNKADRYRHAIGLLKEAVTLALTHEMKGRYLGNLAWDLSVLAEHTSDPTEAESAAAQADECFAGALQLVQDPHVVANIRQNQATHRAMVAARNDDPAAAIAIERTRLAEQLKVGTPNSFATARHNLGNMLMRSGDPSQYPHALRLYQEALQFRRSAQDPRQVWETATGIAELHLRWDARQSAQARREADTHLHEAADAARQLGGGTELHRVALGLGELALFTQEPERRVNRSNTAWTWLAEAMPSLLLDRKKAAQEANLGRALLQVTVQHALADGLVGRMGRADVLGASSAATVLPWWVRAETPWLRMSRARLETPHGVPFDTMQQWRQALADGQPARLPSLLREVHESVPGWLTEAPDLDATRDWLKQHEARALGAWTLTDGTLVALVGPRPEQDRIAWLPDLGLGVEESDLATALRTRGRRAEVLESLSSWVQQSLAPHLRALFDRPPKGLLWCPHGALRFVPHHALFGTIPVWRTPSLAMSPPVTLRTRSEHTTVVIASPAEQSVGDGVIDTAAALAPAQPTGRLLVAAGDRHGPSVHPRAEQLPVDARTVLEECDRASTIVVLAHGHASSPDAAWLHLLHPDGTEDRLDTDRLSRDPRALAGLRIILLSCEAGRTGDVVHQPGGIAGTLLTAGAKEVIAPLWPVRAQAAVEVARSVLDGLKRGRPAAVSLAHFKPRRTAETSDPDLGGRPSKQAKAAARWDAPAFVVFVS